jgi:hypothetical protein
MTDNFGDVPVQKRLAFSSIHNALETECGKFGQSFQQNAGLQELGAIASIILGAEGTSMVACTRRGYLRVKRIYCFRVEPLHHPARMKHEFVAVQPDSIGMLHYVKISSIGTERQLLFPGHYLEKLFLIKVYRNVIIRDL